MNRRAVFYMIGQIIILEGLLLTLPLLVSFCFWEEKSIFSFSITIFIALALGSLTLLISKPSNKIIYAKEGFIIVTCAWIALSAIGCVPFVISGEIPNADVCVLSGPTHAEEVSRLMPTTIVVASHNKETAHFVQDVFMTETFRVYTSSDVKGVELGGSLKNVVALAAGIADGLGYGDNAKAALITRGIAEISRLGVKMGCRPETFSGLTGMGDLIVTCASMHSRNRRCGILLGEGKSLKEAQEEVGMVVEGIYSAKAAIELGRKYEVSLPIIEQVNLILFEGKDAGEAVKELMLREKKDEVSDTQW